MVVLLSGILSSSTKAAGLFAVEFYTKVNLLLLLALHNAFLLSLLHAAHYYYVLNKLKVFIACGDVGGQK